MRILVIGDTHLPWVNWDCVAACAKFAKSYKPDLIIQMGDLVDQHRWSRHMLYADSPSAELEWDMTEEAVKRFFSYFKAPMTVLEGNHCRRYMMRATEAQIPKRLVKEMHTLFDVENVTWHLEPKPLIVDRVRFVHGDEMPGNAWQKAQRLGESLWQGHDHHLYLKYISTFERRIFGGSSGTMMDGKSIAARYAAKNPMICDLGWSTITDGIPHLYPWD